MFFLRKDTYEEEKEVLRFFFFFQYWNILDLSPQLHSTQFEKKRKIQTSKSRINLLYIQEGEHKVKANWDTKFLTNL